MSERKVYRNYTNHRMSCNSHTLATAVLRNSNGNDTIYLAPVIRFYSQANVVTKSPNEGHDRQFEPLHK